LTNGIRYFDLRPKSQNGTWFLYHGHQDHQQITQDFSRTKTVGEYDFGFEGSLIGVSVTGPYLSDVLNDVKRLHGKPRELVI